MVLEIAILDVKPGQESSFERDFSVASGCITTVNGYISHELYRCLEKPNRYILLVRWETLEAHTEGFRRSPSVSEVEKAPSSLLRSFPYGRALHSRVKLLRLSVSCLSPAGLIGARTDDILPSQASMLSFLQFSVGVFSILSMTIISTDTLRASSFRPSF
jgi:heme-degrading monooxygenase HmoA